MHTPIRILSLSDIEIIKGWIVRAKQLDYSCSVRFKFDSDDPSGYGNTDWYINNEDDNNYYSEADIFINSLAGNTYNFIKGIEYRDQIFPEEAHTLLWRDSITKYLVNVDTAWDILDYDPAFKLKTEPAFKLKPETKLPILATVDLQPDTGPIWWQLKDKEDVAQRQRIMTLRNEVRRLLGQ
jgi:hypothetical protein